MTTTTRVLVELDVAHDDDLALDVVQAATVAGCNLALAGVGLPLTPPDDPDALRSSARTLEARLAGNPGAIAGVRF